MMNQNEIHDRYRKNFDLFLFDTSISNKLPAKTFLEASDPHCRFCLKPVKQSEKSEKHIISEFLGNHNLFTRQECEACNNKSAKFEKALADYLLFNRSLTATKGKNGIPKFHSSASDLWIEHDGERLTIKYGLNASWAIDSEKRTIRIVGKRPRYRPLYIYLALLKYALSVIPEQRLRYFGRSRQYYTTIGKGLVYEPFMIESQVPFFRKDPVFFLAFRKEDCQDMTVPYCQFALAYSNFLFQIYVPSDNDHSRTMNFVPFVALPHNPGTKRDLSKRDFVENDIVEMQFKFEGHELLTQEKLRRAEMAANKIYKLRA